MEDLISFKVGQSYNLMDWRSHVMTFWTVISRTEKTVTFEVLVHTVDGDIRHEETLNIFYVTDVESVICYEMEDSQFRLLAYQ